MRELVQRRCDFVVAALFYLAAVVCAVCCGSNFFFFVNTRLFQLFEQFQKLVAFLIPIFGNVLGNVDGSWRVTSKLRGSTLIQVA